MKIRVLILWIFFYLAVKARNIENVSDKGVFLHGDNTLYEVVVPQNSIIMEMLNTYTVLNERLTENPKCKLNADHVKEMRKKFDRKLIGTVKEVLIANKVVKERQGSKEPDKTLQVLQPRAPPSNPPPTATTTTSTTVTTTTTTTTIVTTAVTSTATTTAATTHLEVGEGTDENEYDSFYSESDYEVSVGTYGRVRRQLFAAIAAGFTSLLGLGTSAYSLHQSNEAIKECHDLSTMTANRFENLEEKFNKNTNILRRFTKDTQNAVDQLHEAVCRVQSDGTISMIAILEEIRVTQFLDDLEHLQKNRIPMEWEKDLNRICPECLLNKGSATLLDIGTAHLVEQESPAVTIAARLTLKRYRIVGKSVYRDVINIGHIKSTLTGYQVVRLELPTTVVITTGRQLQQLECETPKLTNQLICKSSLQSSKCFPTKLEDLRNCNQTSVRKVTRPCVIQVIEDVAYVCSIKAGQVTVLQSDSRFTTSEVRTSSKCGIFHLEGKDTQLKCEEQLVMEVQRDQVVQSRFTGRLRYSELNLTKLETEKLQKLDLKKIIQKWAQKQTPSTWTTYIIATVCTIISAFGTVICLYKFRKQHVGSRSCPNCIYATMHTKLRKTRRIQLDLKEILDHTTSLKTNRQDYVLKLDTSVHPHVSRIIRHIKQNFQRINDSWLTEVEAAVENYHLIAEGHDVAMANQPPPFKRIADELDTV